MSCPSQDCPGARPEQDDLTAPQKMMINHPEWANRALLCSNCGCIYTPETQGHPHIRGWLDNSVAGLGWKVSRGLSGS